MAKSAANRITEALSTIGSIAGSDERTIINGLLTPHNRQQWGNDISLGGVRVIKFSGETEKRKIIRALLLVGLAQQKINSLTLSGIKTSLLSLDVNTLTRRLRACFAYKPYAGSFANRTYWNPNNFTNPKNHDPIKYKYIVHTIMGASSNAADLYTHNPTQKDRDIYAALKAKYQGFAIEDTSNPMKKKLMVKFYQQYLEKPNIVQQNIISSTLISEAKHATYYPFGFIMHVPPECVYITSPKDVGVKNRTTNIIGELSSVGGNTILTPDTVLANTVGTNNDTGYNEIVIIGTSPEGKQVSVTGIFVKTDAKGNIMMRNGALSKDTTSPYVNAEIQKLIQTASLVHNLPIVPIVDTSSGVSVTPWPFVSTGRARTASVSGTKTSTTKPRRMSFS